MKDNVLIDKDKINHCTGCSTCAAICPVDAIKIIRTKEGFYEPSINDDVCTNCGLCKSVCYKFDSSKYSENEKSNIYYSAINKNKKELLSATSGGVSSELMKECIKEGYIVLGVEYDYDKNIAVTNIATSIEEIEKFKGSKYFQSYTLDAFRKILKDRSDQKYAVFGTPCQIYSLARWAEKFNKREKFLFVDIFCHGCPSINLWEKYLKYNKRKNNITKFDKIDFRSKTYGWHEFSTTFHKDAEVYNSPKFNDMFYNIFFDKNALNYACYDCKTRSSLTFTDIRLGDFWGYHYDMNTTGVSAVALCTERGKEVFEKVKGKFILAKYNFEETVRAQSYGKNHYFDNRLRKYTLELLSSDLTMEEVFKKYKKTYSMKKRFKILMKNMIKKLPENIYLKFKMILHKA